MDIQCVCFILCGVCYTRVHCWSCLQDITREYARPGSRAVISFQTSIQSSTGLSEYTVVAYNGSIFYALTFYKGVFQNAKEHLNSTFIGEVATGNFTIQTNNIQSTDAGIYRLQYSEGDDTSTLKCSTLYILGIPTQPNIQSSNDPSVGDDATLTCESTSTTVPTNHSLSQSYNWNMDNSAVTSSGRYSLSGNTLVVSNVAKIDKDLKFTCKFTEVVTNGYTSDSSGEYSVNVLYGPDVVILTPSNTNYIVDQATTLTDVKCYADCNPVCTYKWTKQGHTTPVSNTDTLPLGNIDTSYIGAYTCTATNADRAVTKNSPQVRLNVRYGPDTEILTPETSSYTRNVNTVLPDITCASDCYPTCTIKWTKSGSVIRNTGVLSLGTLDKTDTATYTCTVSNPGTSATVTKHVEVFVRYGPDRCDISVQSPYTVREGNSIPTITCQSVCYPACSQGWSNVSINSPVGSDGDLSLGLVTRSKAGYYSCTCSNIVQGYYDTSLVNIVHVVVQYPPDVNVVLSTTDISEGNELILTCDAKGVPSLYNYNTLSQTWGNYDIHNTHSSVSGTPIYSSLRIPSLQLQDSGTYTCRVNNGITNTRGVVEDSVDSVFIKVKVPPKIITHGLTFTGVTGGTATIRVEFYSYPDILNVTFKRYDGSAITNGGKYNVSPYGTEVTDKFHGTDVTLDGSQANMVISDLKPEDFGVYTLTLSNQLSTTVTKVILVAESRPDEPTHFTYLYKDNTHTCSWLGGFNGGYAQTFVIQTSIVGIEDWINRTTITEILPGVTSYQASINALPPGIYVARIFAWTVKGTSVYVGLNNTFSSVTIESDPEIPTCPVGVVAGGFSTVIVVLIIATGSVVFYKCRYGQKDRNSARSVNRKSHNTTVEETSYYNVANQGDTNTQQSVKSESVQENDLQDVSSYEALDANNEAVSTYSSLTPAVERHEDTVAYNNLQLHQLSA